MAGLKREKFSERVVLRLPLKWGERLEAAAATEATTKSAIARAAIIARLRTIDPKLQPEAV
jgi:predicted DNA-binding protein